VGSKTVSSLSIPMRDLSIGSEFPVAGSIGLGEAAEKAEAVLTIEARTRAVESFMVGRYYQVATVTREQKVNVVVLMSSDSFSDQ
jgi:hypothetical protein